jgi:hypothetical protein
LDGKSAGPLQIKVVELKCTVFFIYRHCILSKIISPNVLDEAVKLFVHIFLVFFIINGKIKHFYRGFAGVVHAWNSSTGEG